MLRNDRATPNYSLIPLQVPALSLSSSSALLPSTRLHLDGHIARPRAGGRIAAHEISLGLEEGKSG